MTLWENKLYGYYQQMAVLTLLSLHSSDCFSQLFPIDLGGEKWQFLEGCATSGFQNGYFRFIINMTWMWKWAYLTHLWVFPKHFHTGFMLFTTLGNDLAQKIKIIKKLWQYQYYTLKIIQEVRCEKWQISNANLWSRPYYFQTSLWIWTTWLQITLFSKCELTLGYLQ